MRQSLELRLGMFRAIAVILASSISACGPSVAPTNTAPEGCQVRSEFRSQPGLADYAATVAAFHASLAALRKVRSVERLIRWGWV